MLKSVDIVLVALMISAAAWTYSIKHQAEATEEAIVRLDRQIKLEQETIALLEADWSLLNSPDRLQRLAANFQAELALEPIRPDQVIEPDELPARPVNLVPNPDNVLGGYAEHSQSVVR